MDKLIDLISKYIGIDRSHAKCSECGVGIIPQDITFIISAQKVKCLCPVCAEYNIILN